MDNQTALISRCLMHHDTVIVDSLRDIIMLDLGSSTSVSKRDSLSSESLYSKSLSDDDESILSSASNNEPPNATSAFGHAFDNVEELIIKTITLLPIPNRLKYVTACTFSEHLFIHMIQDEEKIWYLVEGKEQTGGVKMRKSKLSGLTLIFLY